LGQGLVINNLWYTNYSDWNDCRITGMTRYAAFWAEDGRPVAPIETMRFDDSLYRMLGENLIGLTGDRQFLIDTHSYERRSTTSYRLPGALIADFRLTL
jgi:predicted Zn-dependent protease